METENRKADKKKAKEPKLAQNIMNCEAKTFIGKRIHIVTKDGATGAQARAFMNKLESDGTMEQLKAFAAEEKNYIAGICTNFTSKGYDYWVAVEVEPDMERPEGFEMTEAATPTLNVKAAARKPSPKSGRRYTTNGSRNRVTTTRARRK